MREKLTKIIGDTQYGNQSYIGNNFQRGFIEKIADNLIANGVTIPVRCKDCKHYSKDGNWCHRNSHFDDDVYSMNWNDFGEDDFCSYGERKKDV